MANSNKIEDSYSSRVFLRRKTPSDGRRHHLTLGKTRVTAVSVSGDGILNYGPVPIPLDFKTRIPLSEGTSSRSFTSFSSPVH